MPLVIMQPLRQKSYERPPYLIRGTIDVSPTVLVFLLGAGRPYRTARTASTALPRHLPHDVRSAAMVRAFSARISDRSCSRGDYRSSTPFPFGRTFGGLWRLLRDVSEAEPRHQF